MKATLLRSVLVPGLTALALAFAVTSASADDKEPKKEKMPTKADLKKYDANGDGQLDEAEKAQMKVDLDAKKEAAKKERLEKYDANKDGKVGKDEKAAEDADKAARKAEREAKKAAKEAEKKN